MWNAAPRGARCGAVAAALLGLAALCGPSQAGAAPAGEAPATHAQTAASSSVALQNLTIALAPEMDAARLDASSPTLAAGDVGAVTLTLPANLLATVQGEAGKVGLGKAAAHVSVSARLTGSGYDITPNGEQSSKLSSGQPLSFSWQVKATGAARAPLNADVKASLEGAGAPRGFALATLAAAVAAPPAASASPVSAKPGKLALPAQLKLNNLHMPDWRRLRLPNLNDFSLKQLQIPGHKTLSLPGLGAVPSQKLVTGVILIVVVLLLLIIGRNASVRRARAERRRRFRTFEGTSFGDEGDHDG